MSTEKVVSVRLKFNDDGTVAGAERVSTAMKKVGTANDETSSSARKVATDLDGQKVSLNQIEGALNSVTSAIQGMIAAWGLSKILSELKEVTMAGVEFNSTLQQSQLAMRATIATFTEMTTATGHHLDTVEKYNAAQSMSIDLQQKLKIAALATTLQYADLVGVLTKAMPYLLKLHDPAGNSVLNDPQKMVDFTAKFSQGAAAFGLAPDEIPNNVRYALQGGANPRIARFASALESDLGTTAQAHERIKQMQEEGTLLDYLMKKLEAFGLAGKDAMDTYAGALSNLKDAWKQALGEGTVDATGVLKDSMLEVRDLLVTVDEKGHATFNESIVSIIKSFASGLTGITVAGVGVLKFFNDLDETPFFKQMHANSDKTIDYMKSGYQNLQMFMDGQMSGQGTGYAARPTDAFIPGQYGPTHRFMTGIPKGGLKITGVPSPGEDDGSADKLTSFNKWMVQFEEGAIPTGGDSLAKVLQKIAIERKGAIEELNKREGELGDSNVNWKKKLAVISASFDNKESDASQTYFESFTKGFESFQKLADKAKAGEDPITVALKAIEDARGKALADFDAFARKNKLALNLGDIANGLPAGMTAENIKNGINAGADQQGNVASAGIIAPIDQQTLAGKKYLFDLTSKMDIESQKQTEQDRLSEITDSLSRQLEVRVAAIRQRAAEEVKASTDAKLSAKDLAEALLKIETDKNKKIQDLTAETTRRQTIGTDEWTNDLNTKIQQSVIPNYQLMQNAVVDSVAAMHSTFDNFFGSIVEGQMNVGQSLEGFAKSLGHVWASTLATMLQNTITTGQSMTTQLKGAWDTMNQGGVGGALAGAGVGSMVGGLFQGPNNEAGTGGTIGGLIGAIIGTYFGATGIGAMIGSAIGTAIGGMIVKGKDHISIAINNATAAALGGASTVTGNNEFSDTSISTFGSGSMFGGSGGSISINEKGISATTRAELLTQIQRKVREEMKGWQSILDSFPQYVRDQLALIKMPGLNLTGGVESADITDQGALGTLSDFLSQKLPKAAFEVYKGALGKGLELMGVKDSQVTALFSRWAELQGQELHDAIAAAIVTIVDFQTTSKLYLEGGSLEKGVAAAKAANATPLSHLGDLNEQIRTIVDGLPKLTDVNDQLAAMTQITALTKQRYADEIAALQQIDAMEKASHDSIQQQIEGIKVSGMDAQGKMDFFFKRMSELRTQLGNSTDPADIARITGQIQGYANSALGLAPDDKGLQDKIVGILDDIDKTSGKQYDAARQAIFDQDKLTATLLQDAARALLSAAGVIGGRTSNHRDTNPGGGFIGGIGTDPPSGPGPYNPIIPDGFTTGINAATAALANLTAATTPLAANSDIAKSAGYLQTIDTTDRSVVTEIQLLRAAVEALRNDVRSGGGKLTITADAQAFLDTIGVSIVQEASDVTIGRIRRNPDIIAART
jgi:hypothetical protein